MQLNYFSLLLLLCSCLSTATDSSKDPVIYASLEDIVKERGYPIEAHTVTTDDGYILTVHRIKHGKGQLETDNPGHPVMLQHGLMDTSEVFLGSSGAMAYYMAEAGYDVWIGNSRGNFYSRKHVSIDVKTNASFWDFSFHEMGMYDVPGVLDYIRHETEYSKIHYVGMSMGTTMFLVMGTMRPDYLELVDCIILLAPVACPQNAQLLATKARRLVLGTLISTMTAVGMTEVYTHGSKFVTAAHSICGSSGWTGHICDVAATVRVTSHKDVSTLKRQLEGHRLSSTGSNIKTYNHFLQMAEAGKFQPYDYGVYNKLHYDGRSSPPEYDLHKITKRIYLFSGGADLWAEARDVTWLSENLSDSIVISEDFKDFKHEHFIFGENLEDTLYKTIDRIIRDRPNKEDLQHGLPKET